MVPVGGLGSLDTYIDKVNRMPMLSDEEEKGFAQALRDNNNVDAARALVLSHLRLVVSISRQYLGYGLPHADLIQEGNIGLMKAIKRFDPDRGVRLVSYAIHWIKAEIHEYVLKNWRMVKVATTKAQRKLFFNLRSQKTGLQSLTQNEIDTVAENLNVKREDVAEMEARLAGSEFALEGQTEDGEQTYAPIAYLADMRYEPTQVMTSQARDQLHGGGLDQALASLDARSRRIVQARWLEVSDEGGGGATLQTLAEEFGVSAERIRQIEAVALKKMRGVLPA
ncbi:MAG: RNA polymerase sigma factor RpoH [Ottowia sp.]|nr:RNA polymerase sigma factor RpoH [Ottowia sp.]